MTYQSKISANVAFFLGLTTMRMMLDVFLVAALVLRLVASNALQPIARADGAHG